MVARLLDEAKEGYEIAISWKPGRSMPVSIFLLRVNGIRVAHDELDTDSPFIVAKIGTPGPSNKFKLDWSIKPEVPVDILVVSMRNRTTGAQTVVDKKKAPDQIEPWTETEVSVDAP